MVKVATETELLIKTSELLENRCYIIEINDNPNVDAENEDGVLKDAIYREIMGSFLRRIEAHKRGAR